MNTNIIDQFARVNGSGLFFLDDFCALTGCPPQRAASLLSRDTRIELLGSGLYLLKPQPKPRRAPRYDWAFKPAVQKAIFSACDAYPTKANSGPHRTRGNHPRPLPPRHGTHRKPHLTPPQRNQILPARRFKPLTTYYRELSPVLHKTRNS